MSDKMGVRVLLVVSGLVLGAFLVTRALAGFTAMPLKAELDLAETVVVGKIIGINEDKRDYDGKLVWGRASIMPSRVLKGGKDRTPGAGLITISVVMQLDYDLTWQMQSPPKVYKKNDEGIWLIMANGQPSHGYGLLDKDRLKEVEALLDELDKRVWSDEVGGLKVWAGAPKHDWHPRDPQQVVFAVKNVSKSTIWLPHSCYQGLVTAIVRDAAGKEVELLGIGEGIPPEGRSVCYLLEPGRTRYMHPDGADYGFIVIPRDLSPGKYTVTVALANMNDGETPSAEPKPVDAWKGKVVAPSFTLEIPKPPEEEKG